MKMNLTIAPSHTMNWSEGDRWSDISAEYNVSIEKLRELNPQHDYEIYANRHIELGASFRISEEGDEDAAISSSQTNNKPIDEYANEDDKDITVLSIYGDERAMASGSSDNANKNIKHKYGQEYAETVASMAAETGIPSQVITQVDAKLKQIVDRQDYSWWTDEFGPIELRVKDGQLFLAESDATSWDVVPIVMVKGKPHIEWGYGGHAKRTPVSSLTEEILEDIVETTWPGFKGNRKPWEPGFVPARQ